MNWTASGPFSIRARTRAWRGLLSGSAGVKLLLYLLLMQVAVQIAGPYFTCYMLAELEFSYGQFVALTAAAFVARIVVLPALGSLTHRFGAHRLLWVGAVGIVPLPALWLISGSFRYLLVVQVLAGAAWAAHELAMLLLFFDSIPRTHRTSVLTFFNLANAAAMVAGTLIGAGVLGLFGEARDTYLLLFAISSAGRLLPPLLLWRLPKLFVEALPVAVRVLAVRPSAGSIERPILPTLQSAVPNNAQAE